MGAGHGASQSPAAGAYGSVEEHRGDTITSLSVAVALVIGTIEIGGLVSTKLDLSGSFWSSFENVDINVLGFVVFGMFAATWAIALVVWRLARIEERWSAREDSGPAH
jgi:nickel/cobalt transporter (NiCoT) family protein